MSEGVSAGSVLCCLRAAIWARLSFAARSRAPQPPLELANIYATEQRESPNYTTQSVSPLDCQGSEWGGPKRRSREMARAAAGARQYFGNDCAVECE